MVTLIALMGAISLSATACEAVDHHSDAEYRRQLVLAEQAYTAEQYGELTGLVRCLETFFVHEVPTYEWRLFEVVLRIQAHEFTDAREQLQAYEDMLRIESGVLPCESGSQGVTQADEMPASRLAREVMCAEAYLGYYANPSPAILLWVDGQWPLVTLVRDQLDRAEGLGSE